LLVLPFAPSAQHSTTHDYFFYFSVYFLFLQSPRQQLKFGSSTLALFHSFEKGGTFFFAKKQPIQCLRFNARSVMAQHRRRPTSSNYLLTGLFWFSFAKYTTTLKTAAARE
jgi:hypothetical protein